MNRYTIGIACLLAATVAVAEQTEFAKYQVIIDRAPFGALSGPGPAAGAPSFTQQFKFVGIVESNRIVQAIINDTKGNRVYFRSAGETIDNVKIVSVDVEPPQLTLQRGLETGMLEFEERKVTASPSRAMTAGPRIYSPTSSSSHGSSSESDPRRIPFRRETQ